MDLKLPFLPSSLFGKAGDTPIVDLDTQVPDTIQNEEINRRLYLLQIKRNWGQRNVWW